MRQVRTKRYKSTPCCWQLGVARPLHQYSLKVIRVWCLAARSRVDHRRRAVSTQALGLAKAAAGLARTDPAIYKVVGLVQGPLAPRTAFSPYKGLSGRNGGPRLALVSFPIPSERSEASHCVSRYTDPAYAGSRR